MPQDVSGTEKVLGFLAKEISPNTYVNVMDQYRPCGEANKDEYIKSRLTSQEFQKAMATARKVGLKRLDPRDQVRLIFRL
jgi:putative pyruvate formate lyase activating enzyme